MGNLAQSRVSALATFGLAVGLVAISGGQASAGLLYQQTPDFPSSSNFSAWTSTYDPTTYGSIYNAYDNFTLGSTATVSSLTWQGFSFNYNTLMATSIPVLSFNVEFFANSSGTPGALLSSQNVSFTETVAGTSDFFGNGTPETIYNYSASLAAGFTAAAGTTYWVSIQAVTDFPAFWTWTSGEGGDGMSYQTENPAYGSNTGPRTGDRAFSLFSVPEPSSLALCGVAALTGVVARRKARQGRVA